MNRNHPAERIQELMANLAFRLGKTGGRKMILQDVGEGNWKRDQIILRSTKRLRWVDADNPRIYRTPSEKTTLFPKPGPFVAAGKEYASIEELAVEAGEHYPWFRDKYGRQVLYLRVIFPCFDSYDYINEGRYERSLYLCEDNKLTFIHADDDMDVICVTEDAMDVKISDWESFQCIGYHTK